MATEERSGWLRSVLRATVVMLAVGAVGLALVILYMALHQPNAQDTVLLSQSAFYADSPASVRVLVRNGRTMEPLEGARARLALQGEGAEADLGEFVTGPDGTVDGSVRVPELEPGRYTLMVRAASRLGTDTIESQVDIRRPYRLYLTTDKPIYQPGQTIHVRAMVLNRLTLKPFAGGPVTFEVEDPKGNKVFRSETTTSGYGISSADFELARELNTGRYRIRATAGDVESEKVVTVKRYVLPKFQVSLSTDSPYYLPAQTLTGDLKAEYFFGKPVADAQVTVTGSTIIEEAADVLGITGTTDADGTFSFSVPLPDYFTGVPLAGGNAVLRLRAEVTDTAGHTHEGVVTRTVAEEPIQVQVLSESGGLVPGVENLIYIVTSYPDGRPARCRVRVRDRTLQTDASGVAVFPLTPASVECLLHLTAEDEGGRRVSVERRLVWDRDEPDFLLRTDRGIYDGGQTVNLTLLSTRERGTYFVDVIKERQTMLTRTLQVEDGRGTLALDLPAALFGTLKLNAYSIGKDGQTAADTRVIHVNQAGALRVTAEPDRPVYRPGETADIRFRVQDPEGNPVPAALGVSIVDEAVFHVGENRPGLLQQFWLADREILEPAYQIKHFASPARLLGATDASDRLALAAFSRAGTSSLTEEEHKELEEIEAMVGRRTIELVREYRDRDQVRRMLERPIFQRVRQLVDRGTVYPIRRDTYSEKVRDWQGTRRRFFETLWKAIGLILLACGPLALLGTAGYSAFRILRTGADLESAEEGELMQATRRLFFSMVFLFVLPVTYLIPPVLAGTFGLWLDEKVLWAPFCFNTAVVIVLFVYRWRWARTLMDSDRARYLGEDSVLLTTGFAVQYVATRAWFIAGAYTASETSMVFAALCSLGLSLMLLASAHRIFSTIARRLECTSRWSRVGCWLLIPVIASGLGFLVLFPTMASARRRASTAAAVNSLRAAHSDLYLREREKNGTASSGSDGPRVRQYFPETLLWRPQIITDAQGRADLKVPLADSITTWRLSGDAVSGAGALGATTTGVRVFQDFFVDIDAPVALTRHDMVSLPVSCYNYLDRAQRVRLTLQDADWCTLQGGAERTVELAPREVRSVHFPIRAEKVGRHDLTVVARGEAMSDAVRRRLRVRPDGTKVERVHNGRATGAVRHDLYLPPGAVPDSQKLLLKVYGSTFSQVVEGTEGLLRKPYGCFEQTSSCTYPNVLALLYMQETGQVTPEIEARARKLINTGYQRLLTFEVGGGGFDWYGCPPAKVILTAYGILEFTDMARVHSVDRAIIERSRRWIFERQKADGSWSPRRTMHTWHGVEGDFVTTAYVAWTLAESGEKGPEQRRALAYLRRHAPQADNTYALALAANALLTDDRRDPTCRSIVGRLRSRFTEAGEGARLGSTGRGAVYSYGFSLDVATTALGALALMKDGRYPETERKALLYLTSARQSDGTWGSTQATILALKALLRAAGATPGSDASGRVTVRVNGRHAGTIEITPENSDMLQMRDLNAHLRPGENTITLEKAGEMTVPYQLVAAHWMPGEQPAAKAEEPLEINVAYDRSRLAEGDVLGCTVEVTRHGKTPVPMAIVDLGIPPGFTLDPSAFRRMVDEGRLAKFDHTGNQCILYLRSLDPGQPVRFTYQLRARYPIRAQAPPSRLYEYYNPENEARSAPQQIIIEAR